MKSAGTCPVTWRFRAPAAPLRGTTGVAATSRARSPGLAHPLISAGAVGAPTQQLARCMAGAGSTPFLPGFARLMLTLLSSQGKPSP